MIATKHTPVLLNESLDGLNITKNHWYIDGTFGGGGHTSEILNHGGKVIAFDFDQESIDRGHNKFKDQIEQKQLILVRENFDKIGEVIKRLQDNMTVGEISGILFDFGTSVDQLTSIDRGLSFMSPDADLDMRMDTRLQVKASDLLKVLPAKQLEKIFSEFGGEKDAKHMANVIVKVRKKNPQQLSSVGNLVALIDKSKRQRRSHLNPATKIFQALRIAVNDELNNISRAIPQALDVIKSKGRIATISFHEGEDRIAKNYFKKWEQQELGKKINKKAISPSLEEIKENKKSRSAKLRIFEKC